MSGRKRILLLSVSAGAGHGRAAEALRAAAQTHFPGITAEHIDVMTLVPRSFRALYAEYYVKLVEHHPSAWAYLYHATDKMPRDALFAKLQRAIERLNTRKLRDGIENFAPEHIICTHFLPAELLAHHIKRGRSALLDLFWGGRPMTGYHAWVFPFIAMVFHLPVFVHFRWSWRLEARIISMIMLFWVMEDVLWFVLNPAFGWNKFSTGHVPWHKYWWAGLPVDYWLSTVIGIVLFAWSYRARQDI